MKNNCIIVPYYNEEIRLPVSDFERNLASNKILFICFVNDGSSDNSIQILNSIHQKFPENILVVDKKQNAGKSTAIFTGVNEALKWKHLIP